MMVDESVFAERIAEACARRTPLHVHAGGSKAFYGNPGDGQPLDISGFKGVVAYEPSELVITARGGTPLADVEEHLRKEAQMLAFEPPHFGRSATLGGCVAAGLSGPRRASAGAVRDYVLGVRVIDGRGRVLTFGGQVMKNVAGYDVSRLFAGSLGTLGVLLDVSIKVLPRPRAEATMRLEMDEPGALEAMNRWAGTPLPISATAWRDNVLTVRLSGAEAAVAAARRQLGGQDLDAAEAGEFWRAIREHELPFFADARPLWRLSVPSAAGPLGIADSILEWNGAQRWVHGEDSASIRSAAARAGGHATRFRAKDRSEAAFPPLSATTRRLHVELKRVFDPEGILNPGRLYPEF